MEKALLIAEKPSLARTIEASYNKHKADIPYDLTVLSQRGHLVTLKEPDEMDPDLKAWKWDTLPIEPEQHGGWSYKVIKEKRTGKFKTAEERYKDILDALKSGHYDFVIHAGDPDQEGQLLVDLVLKMARNTLPVKRFWTNDTTDTAVFDALKNLRDNDHDPMLLSLLDAAYGRQHSDYRFGMNLSRAATLKMGGMAALGRVKTPILAIVCRREDEIENFVPSTTYGVKAHYTEGFNGILFRQAEMSSDKNASQDEKSGIVWFETKEEAEDLIKKLGKKAVVLETQQKQVTTYAPKLFKLATLQIAAGKYGISDAESLKILQKLYEMGYMSYPRTSCEYISSNEDFIGIIKAVMQSVPEYAPFIKTISKSTIEKVRNTKKWVNDKAIAEEGHTALRPTDKALVLKDLSANEATVYKLVCRQFIAMFLPPLIQDHKMLIADIDGETFKSLGKTLVSPGYTEIFGTKFTDMVIPDKKKGDVLDVKEFELTEKTTTCPSRFTSPDLIAVCENPQKYLADKELRKIAKELKIGTPATRSSIIRELIDRNQYMYELKKGKKTYIAPTDTGRTLIRNLDGCAICKVDMTGLLEEDLKAVRSGDMSLSDLEEKMRKTVSEYVQEIKDKKDIQQISKYKEIGDCPICGKPLISGPKGFFCSGYKEGCKIGAFKKICDSMVTDEEFLRLVNGERIVKKIKKGKTTWDQELEYSRADTKFVFVQKPAKKSDYKCPCCGGEIEETDWNFKCTTCEFTVRKNIAKKNLSDSDISDIFTNGMTKKISGFTGKKGKFSASLKVNKEEKKLDFVF